ncbi:hypothetical protein ACX80Z_11910 [Arthrobacter sp. TMT4-20]
MTGHESPTDGQAASEVPRQTTNVSINMERAVKLAQILEAVTGNGADYLARLIEAQVDSIDLDKFRGGPRDFQTAGGENRTLATSRPAGREKGTQMQEATQRARSLARKINLLLETRLDESGRPYEFPAIRVGTKNAGYTLTPAKWTKLRNGQLQIVPDACLQAIATVFGVDPEYLLREDAPFPPEVVQAIKGSIRRATRS